MGEVVVTSFGEGGINHAGDLQGVVGTGDDAEMTDGKNRRVIETINERHMKGCLLKVQRSCGFGYSEKWIFYCG